MEIVKDNAVLTIEEAAQLLKLSDSFPILTATENGILPFIQIDSEKRIIGKDFNDFLSRSRSTSTNGKGKQGSDQVTKNHPKKWKDLKIKAGQRFSHKWPDGTVENFRDVLEGTVETKSGFYSIKIGFTTRRASGEDRERAVVFIDGRPIREFCGADDFEKSKTMASVIKVHGKQVRSVDGFPPHYRHFKVEPYNKYITGPYASSNLAIFCKKEDTETMVEHALIRQEELEK